MSSPSKRVREQAVVYLGQRDRALLENLTKTTGLSRTEIFRRGLWALAAQTLPPQETSAFEYLIANAIDVDLPPDFSERSDEYLYGGGYDALTKGAATVSEAPSGRPARKRKSPGRARPR
jgi:hypothetical protein